MKTEYREIIEMGIGCGFVIFCIGVGIGLALLVVKGIAAFLGL